MKKKTKLSLVVVSLLVAVMAVAAVWGYSYYKVHKKKNFSKSYTLYVYPEMTESQILDSLESGAGMIDRDAMERAFDSENLSSRIKPGKYQISPSNTSIYVARMLTRGWQVPHKLTLSGTMRNKGVIAKKIANQMMVDYEEVAAALEDEEFLEGYGFTTEDVFGMILPDTYEMYWDATVEEIFDRLKKEYDTFWTEERLAKAKERKLTQKEVSVLASIVSGETNVSSEYATIAGVYLNRLNIGMLLQADPTVCFCYDYTVDRVLKKHLPIDSPYNTYKYKGLPPAPINVPPKACLDAVLSPEEHDYLYFCASADFDGSHMFTKTYSDHKINSRKYQRELDKLQKSKTGK